MSKPTQGNARATDEPQSLPIQGALHRAAVTGLAAARIGARRIERKMTPADSSSENESIRQREHEAAIGRILFSAMSQLRGTALKAS